LFIFLNLKKIISSCREKKLGAYGLFLLMSSKAKTTTAMMKSAREWKKFSPELCSKKKELKDERCEKNEKKWAYNLNFFPFVWGCELKVNENICAV
jgi:hypothetical protein